ncbi:proteasome maturation protein [Condylostylus longicornis]|uniref:proteasome maturation protein n=1 Tax=Condylostylus longicornis TaxID=2530218 RepID=UPI00244E2815|nr:proteasome maturation protein [Condylostylus longicornis]
MDLALYSKQPKATQLDININPGGPTQKNALSQSSNDHVLKLAQKDYDMNHHNINMQILRNRDGLHAPLKLSMEIASAKKIGRLPFLPSSNVMLDVLTGRDEIIDFSDYLGTEDTFEDLRQPHAVVEKHLGVFECR